MTTVTVRAPAKINLGLSVGSPRPDGYHPLATVYQAISLYDEVKARPAPEGSFTLAVTGEGQDDVPLGDSNLAVRAAVLLAKHFEVGEGAALSIHKTIAVSGGLAGGSADAAGALLACDALWNTHAGRDELLAIAAELGSDVPFCLVGGNAIGTGRGENVSAVLARGSYEWVLAYADVGLSTPQVFAELDRLRATRSSRDLANSDPANSDRASGDASDRSWRAPPLREPALPEALMTALRGGDPYVVAPAMHNDLQPAALRLRPSLRHTLNVGDEFGALGSMISGSGPTCLFLAADADHAVDLAVALSGSGTCRLVQRATGPVHGARLVT